MTIAEASQFDTCQYPLAVNLNKISTAIRAVDALNIGHTWNMPIEETMFPGVEIRMFHQCRWLVTWSTGTLIDPSGFNDPTEIGSGEASYDSLDLDSIPWLAYGMFYIVEGVTFCSEYEDPL